MNQKLLSFAIAIICGSQIANAWSWVSSYAYCNGIPNILVDPDGRNPIYDTNGNFLGTDNLGLQGRYYVMNSKNFRQGMPHQNVGDFAIMSNLSESYCCPVKLFQTK